MSKHTQSKLYKQFLKAVSTTIGAGKGTTSYVSNLHALEGASGPQYCLSLSSTELRYSSLFAGDRHHTVLDLKTMAISFDGILQSDSFLADFSRELTQVISDISNRRARVFNMSQKVGA